MNLNDKLKQVHDYIESQFPVHLEKAQEFLRLHSTAGEKTALLDTARWLKRYIKDLGLKAELVGRRESPIVFAKFDAGKPKTLLTYGMYDVHPVSGQIWSSPPFAAEIQALPGIGPSIIARGACNSKGPLVGFLNALHSIGQVDKMPVNMIMTFEGEEEVGSPTLQQFYHQNQELLRADAGFEPFWADYGTDVDRPTLSLGTKGIVNIELTCNGGDWGGPVKGSVHSSVGAWLASPTWRLIKALATLVGDNEEIRIDKFYDDVIPPSKEDEEQLRGMEGTFDQGKMLGIMGARRFKYNLHGVDLLRKYFFSPSIHVTPVTPGEGEVIPSQARVEMTIRLVPKMDPDRTVETVRKYLAKQGYGDINILTLSSYPWSRTSLNEEVVQSMIETYRYHGYDPQIRPLSASATPYYLFSEVLGIPYVWGGLGQAGRSHSYDEYASVEGLKLLEKSIATFLYTFAER